MSKPLFQVRLEKDVEKLIRDAADLEDRPIQTEVNRRLRSTFETPRRYTDADGRIPRPRGPSAIPVIMNRFGK